MTKKKSTKNKGGRPRIRIDWNQFDKLCQLQCTLREIASFFDCSEDTVENVVKREKGIGFSEYYAQKRGTGILSLRRKQFEVAMAGNVTMLIWLGKQYIHQSDKQQLGIKTWDDLEIQLKLMDGTHDDNKEQAEDC